jgi:hypothetical protein
MCPFSKNNFFYGFVLCDIVLYGAILGLIIGMGIAVTWTNALTILEYLN